MGNRINIQPPGYMVLQLNQYAARAHRHDFLAQILRVTYDFFNDHPTAQRDLENMADEDAHAVEEKFIEDNCSEYDFPVLNFYVNAPDFE